MNTASFTKFAALSAISTGISGLLYSLAFIVISRSDPDLGGLLSAFFLMLGGLLATPVLVALYNRLREMEPGFALWAILLGIVGAFGSVIHGGFDLANAINPPAVSEGLPSQINPRGLLTFGVTGLALFVFSWLMRRNRSFPNNLAYLGYLLAIALVVIYLGRLIVLTATNPIILVPALLARFVLNPAWYIWLGLVLWRKQ